MGEKVCLLRFTKEFARGTRVKGDRIQVTANVALVLDDGIVNYFNIPFTKTAVFFQQTVNTYTQSRYQGLADTTGTPCQIKKSRRTPQAKYHASKKIRLPIEGLKTPSGRVKTLNLRFPWFFSDSMITQALGTMIQAHKPRHWFKADRMPRLFMPATAGLAPGAKSGAWIQAELGATANTGSSPIGPLTIVRSQTRHKLILPPQPKQP